MIRLQRKRVVQRVVDAPLGAHFRGLAAERRVDIERRRWLQTRRVVAAAVNHVTARDAVEAGVHVEGEEEAGAGALMRDVRPGRGTDEGVVEGDAVEPTRPHAIDGTRIGEQVHVVEVVSQGRSHHVRLTTPTPPRLLIATTRLGFAIGCRERQVGRERLEDRAFAAVGVLQHEHRVPVTLVAVFPDEIHHVLGVVFFAPVGIRLEMKSHLEVECGHHVHQLRDRPVPRSSPGPTS
jgi:hypothetical protein